MTHEQEADQTTIHGDKNSQSTTDNSKLQKRTDEKEQRNNVSDSHAATNMTVQKTKKLITDKTFSPKMLITQNFFSLSFSKFFRRRNFKYFCAKTQFSHRLR